MAAMRRPPILVLLLISLTLACAGSVTAAAARPPECSQARHPDKCFRGSGKTTPGGGGKASHAGWPRITGVFWMVMRNHSTTFAGSRRHDELLGWHGNDTISGGDGHDVIWGDWDPDQPAAQSDVLNGNGGDDWIYASHGRNSIRAGSGNDYVWATYGHGFIDCGPGTKDTVRLRIHYQYIVKNCERRTRPGKPGWVPFTPKR